MLLFGINKGKKVAAASLTTTLWLAKLNLFVKSLARIQIFWRPSITYGIRAFYVPLSCFILHCKFRFNMSRGAFPNQVIYGAWHWGEPCSLIWSSHWPVYKENYINLMHFPERVRCSQSCRRGCGQFNRPSLTGHLTKGWAQETRTSHVTTRGSGASEVMNTKLFFFSKVQRETRQSFIKQIKRPSAMYDRLVNSD